MLSCIFFLFFLVLFWMYWLIYWYDWCIDMPQEFILKALNFLKNVQIIKALLVWGKGGKLVYKIFIVNVVYIYFSSTWQSCFFKGHGPARWGEQGRVSPSRGRAKRWGGGGRGFKCVRSQWYWCMTLVKLQYKIYPYTTYPFLKIIFWQQSKN